MAMNVMGNGRGEAEPEVMMDINTTPLIDVMLVLLIMLIITIPIQLHAVNLALPVGNPPPPVQPQVVEVVIDAASRVFWNGQALPGPAEVDVRLRELAALPREAQPELHLRPNKDARYETVAAVMAGVQRLELTKFGIVGSEQFAP